MLSKETIAANSNCITPTRPRKPHTFVIEDSPTLSQETVKVTWKWGADSPPVRSLASKHIPKLVKPIKTTLASCHSRSTTRQSCSSPAATSSKDICSENSPKGFNKFHEEMRKIEQESECDMNLRENARRSPSPTSIFEPIQTSRTSEFDFGFESEIIPETKVAACENQPQPVNKTNSASSDGEAKNTSITDIKNDLLNDSDFDQFLLSCTEDVERNLMQQKSSQNTSQNVSSKSITEGSTSSTGAERIEQKSETKKTEPAASASDNNNCDKLWSLMDTDESIDDILSSIDDAAIINSMNQSAKFARHNSMPQNNVIGLNRKSFLRHESMPISPRQPSKYWRRGSLHRPKMINTHQTLPETASSSTIPQKCSSEEIAEKRRQALERLKNRNKLRK